MKLSNRNINFDVLKLELATLTITAQIINFHLHTITVLMLILTARLYRQWYRTVFYSATKSLGGESDANRLRSRIDLLYNCDLLLNK